MIKILHNKLLYFLGLFLIIVSSISCVKVVDNADDILSKNLLQEKQWFLEYKQIGATSKIYVGQSSYFINFLKDNTSNDSDGIKGTYSTSYGTDNKLRINFTVSTRSNIISSFQYVVDAIGANEMIFSFVQNGATNYYYFSTRKQYN